EMTLIEFIDAIPKIAAGMLVVSVPLAVLGHAFSALPWNWARRVGGVLEGAGSSIKAMYAAVAKPLPEKPKADKKDDDKGPPTPPGGTVIPITSALMFAVILLFMPGAFGCGPDSRRTRCPDSDLAKIEAAYVAEAIQVCGNKSYDECE